MQNNFEIAQVCVMMIPGSKGLKSDASLLAGGVRSHFLKKNERIMNVFRIAGV